MSPEYRLQCLQWLKEIGYQTGTGIMVGTPGQTIGHLVEDLLFIERFQPEMIGIGPFIPHHDTPFAGKAAGSMEMTLKLLSIFLTPLSLPQLRWQLLPAMAANEEYWQVPMS